MRRMLAGGDGAGGVNLATAEGGGGGMAREEGDGGGALPDRVEESQRSTITI